MAPNTAGHNGRGLYLQHCASCHRDDRAGTPPEIPSLVGIEARRSFTEVASAVRQGKGRMPGYPQLDATAVNAIVQFVLTGLDTPAAGRGAEGRRGEPPHPLINNSFRFTGYEKFLDADGYPAVVPPWAR